MSDTEERYDHQYVTEEEEPESASAWAMVLRAVVVLLVVAAAVGISAYWIMNRPKAQRRRPSSEAVRVQVRKVAVETEKVVVKAMGTVVPATEVQLASRVGGEIIEVSAGFVPGGRFKAGDVVVRVDPKDYELAVQQQEATLLQRTAETEQRAAEITQRESDVVRAEAALAIEMGQQSVAKREFEILGQAVKPEDNALVLREPQLKSAQADCIAAKAAKRTTEGAVKAATAMRSAAEVALEDAKLDLARTTVKTPFNALVKQQLVDVGSQVSAGSTLGSLVGTDKYWVQVLVPLGQLKWIRVPGTNSETGSAVRIYHETAWGKDAFRTGTVERLMADLEPQGRMARLLVAVDDPLGLKTDLEKRFPLVLDAYVRVEIEGRELPNIVRIGRTELRDGNRAWVMNKDNKLEIRDVTVAWSGPDHVCVSQGLNPGDKLVVSDLGAAKSDMDLRTGDAKPEKPLAGEGGAPEQARTPETPK